MDCFYCHRHIKPGHEMWTMKDGKFYPCHRDCDYMPASTKTKTFEQMMKKFRESTAISKRASEKRAERWKR